MRAQAAIGVFDSGVGGLTVVRSLTERLPKEEIVYLGDTARVPYGSKSAETVARYSRNAARFLVGEGVKMIVIACNTASAFALDVAACGAGAAGARRGRAGGARCRRCHALGARRRHRHARHRALGQLRARHRRRRRARARHGARLPAVRAARRGGLARRRRGRGGGAPLPDGAARRAPGPRRAGARLHPLSAVASAARARRAARSSATRSTLVDSAQAMAEVGARASSSGSTLLRGDADGHGALRCYVTDDARIDEVGHRFLGRHLGEIIRVDL